MNNRSPKNILNWVMKKLNSDEKFLRPRENVGMTFLFRLKQRQSTCVTKIGQKRDRDSVNFL